MKKKQTKKVIEQRAAQLTEKGFIQESTRFMHQESGVAIAMETVERATEPLWKQQLDELEKLMATSPSFGTVIVDGPIDVGARIKQCVDAGLKYDSGNDAYVFGETVYISILDIKTYDHAKWNNLMNLLPTAIGQASISAPAVEGEHTHETPTNSIEIGKRSAESDIATFDVNKQQIAEWKQQYAGLVIKSVDDKATIKLVKEGKSFIRKKRTTTEARRKALKDWYISEGKKIDAAANEYFDLFAEIEDPLTVQLDELEKMENEAERVRLAAEEKETNRRVDMLVASGLEMNGGYYTIGGTIFLDITTIKSMPDDALNEINEKVKAEKIRVDLEGEQQRIQDVISLGMELDGNRFVRKNQYGETTEHSLDAVKAAKPNDWPRILGNIRSVVDAFNRKTDATARQKQQEIEDNNRRQQQAIEDQKQQLERQKISLRETLCKSVGMVFTAALPGYVFKNGYLDVSVDTNDIKTMADEEFQKTIEEFGASIIDAKQKQSDYDADQRRIQLENQQKEQERQRLANEQFIQRQNDLINLGMKVVGVEYHIENEFGDFAAAAVELVKKSSMDEWQQHIALITKMVNDVNEKTQNRRAELLREKEAAKPEIQRVREYMLAVIAINAPAVSDAKVKAILTRFDDEVQIACTTATEKLNAIEG